MAYREIRLTDNAITTALHSTLTHLEQKDSYARFLLNDFSSAFNIIPNRVSTKSNNLSLPHSICLWIKDLLSNSPQRVKVGHHLSPALSLNTSSPQGFVPSPLLYTVYTDDCTPTYPSNSTVKFVNDTTVVGLITGEDETMYRDEVENLSSWCSNNDVIINHKNIIVGLKRN